MDKSVTEASQLFSWALYSLRRGCALWIPEPNNEFSLEYCEVGIQIGDVGILRADGGFDFVFNVCRSVDDPVNQYGVPDDFQPLLWNGAKRRIRHIFCPGEPVLSCGAEKRALGVEGSASVPGIPIGGGVGFSIKFSKDQGAVILPPNGADSVDCQNRSVFRKYAERHAVSWYRFVNETLGMEVENGSIYFITGFDKTDCWENAVFSNNLKERIFEIIVNTGGLAGGGGRFHLSASSLHEAFSNRRSPPNNMNHNQALFIRGFRISMPRKFKTLFSRSIVQVTSTYESSWRDILGKKGSHFPLSREPSSSGSGSGSSQGTSTSSTSPVDNNLLDEARSDCEEHDSDTSVGSGDFIPSLELYHPLKTVNDYILQSIKDRDDVEVVITHDEDWFTLLTDEDIETPDEKTLIRRLQDQLRLMVKDGCAYLELVNESESSHHSEYGDKPMYDLSKDSPMPTSYGWSHPPMSNHAQQNLHGYIPAGGHDNPNDFISMSDYLYTEQFITASDTHPNTKLSEVPPPNYYSHSDVRPKYRTLQLEKSQKQDGEQIQQLAESQKKDKERIQQLEAQVVARRSKYPAKAQLKENMLAFCRETPVWVATENVSTASNDNGSLMGFLILGGLILAVVAVAAKKWLCHLANRVGSIDMVINETPISVANVSAASNDNGGMLMGFLILGGLILVAVVAAKRWFYPYTVEDLENQVRYIDMLIRDNMSMNILGYDFEPYSRERLERCHHEVSLIKLKAGAKPDRLKIAAWIAFQWSQLRKINLCYLRLQELQLDVMRKRVSMLHSRQQSVHTVI